MHAVCFSPIKPHQPASAKGSPRKIIPLHARRQSFSTVQISPPKPKHAPLTSSSSPITGPVAAGLPYQDVFIESEFDLPPLPLLPPDQLRGVITSSAHVTYDWKLLDRTHGMPRQPTASEADILFSLFPRTRSISVCLGILVIGLEELPPRPWPLTVAGLPLYLTTDTLDFFWDLGDTLGAGPEVLEHLDARYSVSNILYEAAIDHFDNRSGVWIFDIAWLFGLWMITVGEDVAAASLPKRVARAPCRYNMGKRDMPREAALRSKMPTDDAWDDTAYTGLLRPGVMLASSAFGDPGEQNYRPPLLTTSGLKVQRDGETYITVAAHGFPLGEEVVHHPSFPSAIGHVEMRLSDTDIALARLHPNVQYTNELFSNEVFGQSRVRSIRRLDDIAHLEPVYMDNPYTGFAEGLYIASQKMRLPADEPVDKFSWVSSMWVWVGQGVSDDKDGSCGTVVTDDQARAVCFYRFIQRKGLAHGVAAEELLNFGYQIADD